MRGRGTRLEDKVMTADKWHALDAALARLPDPHRLVIELRFLTEPRPTLKQVGERLGVSHQRVAQLQAGGVWRVGCHLQRAQGLEARESPTDLRADIAAVKKLALGLLALRKLTVLKGPSAEPAAGQAGEYPCHLLPQQPAAYLDQGDPRPVCALRRPYKPRFIVRTANLSRGQTCGGTSAVRFSWRISSAGPSRGAGCSGRFLQTNISRNWLPKYRH